jgi:hypothetical protein
MKMINVLTGKDSGGRVLIDVSAEDFKNGHAGTGDKWYQVKSDKKGEFVSVKGKKHYIEIPIGQFIPRKDGYCGVEWVNV